MAKRRQIMYTLMKALLAVMLSMCFLIVLVSFVLNANTINDKETTAIQEMAGRVDQEIYTYINSMHDLSELILLDDDVTLFIEAPENASLQDELKNKLVRVLENRQDISSIVVLSTNGTAVTNRNSDLNPYANYRDADWYVKAINYPNQYFLSPSYVQNLIGGEYRWVVSLSRAIVSRGEVKGVLLIDLNFTTIRSVCETAGIGEKGYVYLTDQNGNIIYHPFQRLVYSNLKSETLSPERLSEEGGVRSGDKIYFISGNNEIQWQTVCVLYANQLWREKIAVLPYYILIAAVFAIVILLLSYTISKQITQPLRHLQTAMSQVERGDLNVVAKIHSDNEIGELAETFNHMTQQLNQLMKQNKEEMEQRRASELKALYAQIKPHFLYNTLESIIWMAEKNSQKDIVFMTKNLARLFRTSISVKDELVPLSLELENAESYLAIQKIRYGSKINYCIDTEEGVENYKVVRLLLQPIVENAIYHGIKPKEGSGNISIYAYTSELDLIIEITDDGVGFDPANAKPSKEGTGIGIENVDSRIKLYFGENYGLTFKDRKGGGVRAIITLPILP